ncbi:MAG: PDZ domain-containing protein, partial [Gemmatimonadetes bacterium]|nr:S41 family peptidase [Gemmatimonadota bacterium]NIR77163.1 S41 family peptidase [Gemmatimonadota bacterium]NIT85680.1 S41 family peptidase [Gemmatimonadota bacterium]NIU29509.1 S41 family peptidase [Gemmatimonadota bacterium]NIU34556.1 PDZ domain-containing protein [Gemmatimonadota bacterium]
MKRTTLALLTGLLLLPTAAAAQTGAGPTGAADRADRTRADSAAAEGAEIFLGAFRAIRNYHLEAYGDSALWRKALEGLIQELDDPYATVFTPDEYSEFQEDNTGNYAGIGVTISRLNDLVTITAVFRGTPADQVGLQVGDRIVGVNGSDATDWSIDQASGRIRGRPGTTVDVEIARPGLGESIPFTIRRDEVHVPAVTAERITDDVAYIQIDRVARSSAQEVDSAIAELEGARGVILDLRRNPGGYLDEALELSDLFLEPGQTLASARSRVPGSGGETREERWQARSPARIPDLPIVVLVDEYTASAAEILAGALQDHDRALVMGERTFGKGVVQTLMRLPGNRRIRLTTGSWFTPLGRSLHRPRDREGRPVAESRDTFPTVVTASGREL